VDITWLSAKALFGKVKLYGVISYLRVKKSTRFLKIRKKGIIILHIAEELSVLIKLLLVSSSCLSSRQLATPLTPAVMIAQNIWTTLGHDAPILSFFLLISCVNICTADPARESPVPCKRLQFLCLSFRSVTSDRFVESRRFCLRLNLFVGFSLKALMPSKNSKR